MDMELRQLEFFVAAMEEGSLNRAAERLYTSQPNVSKVIGMLEKELGCLLFERTPRGLRITPYGEEVMAYAREILHNAQIISSLKQPHAYHYFKVSSYPSNMISHILTDLYNESDSSLHIDYREGTVEEITDQVSKGISELGILYVGQRHLRNFQHIISHKKLKFVPLATKEVCVYVGQKNPYYQAESIDFAQLSQLRFVRGLQDFFSLEHHLEPVSVGAISNKQLHNAVLTNSDHFSIDLLLRSDMCSIGIDLMCKQYEQYPIKVLRLNNCEPFLVIGYVKEQESKLSQYSKLFLEKLCQEL